MKRSKLSKTFLLLIAFSLFSFGQNTFAAAKEPDPSSNPVLNNFIKQGARIYFLGARDGLDGWFIVKSGQVQFAYTLPDKSFAIIGAMFGSKSENITGQQVETLSNTNPEVSVLFSGMVRSLAQTSQSAQNAAVSQFSNYATQQTTKAASPPSQVSLTPGQTTPVAQTPALSPGEKLIHALDSASSVLIGGGGAGVPQLYMIMDANCPHCQATWRDLRETVFRNALQIRMIPIGTPDTDNERAGAMFLKVHDPLNAWDKYVSGDKAQLAGTPEPALIAFMRANHELVDSWNIHATPYLVYRGRDGKVKIVEGEPKNIAAVLSDLTL